MSTLIADLPALRAALLFTVPLVYALAAVPSSMAGSLDSGWRWARLGAGLALAASLASLAWLILGGPGIWRGPALAGADAGVHFSLRGDALAADDEPSERSDRGGERQGRAQTRPAPRGGG